MKEGFKGVAHFQRRGACHCGEGELGRKLSYKHRVNEAKNVNLDIPGGELLADAVRESLTRCSEYCNFNDDDKQNTHDPRRCMITLPIPTS